MIISSLFFENVLNFNTSCLSSKMNNTDVWITTKDLCIKAIKSFAMYSNISMLLIFLTNHLFFKVTSLFILLSCKSYQTTIMSEYPKTKDLLESLPFKNVISLQKTPLHYKTRMILWPSSRNFSLTKTKAIQKSTSEFILFASWSSAAIGFHTFSSSSHWLWGKTINPEIRSISL